MPKIPAIDVEPIDRLDEKIRRLVSALDHLRTERARLNEENQRLLAELEAVRARLSDFEGTSVEMSALREEREQIRTRVAEMLEQLEALNL